MTRSHLELQLDHLRAIAALLVVIGHARALFLVPFKELDAPNIAVSALYAVTGLGHEAVMIFFVLSGYLVGGSALRSIRDGRWSWGYYLSRRLTRLYVVLLPALILGGMLDLAGIAIVGGQGVYSGTAVSVVKAGVESRLDVPTFLGNAFFVQTIVTDTFGSNGPLWSLANEFWYYLIFPMLALTLARRQRLLWRTGYALGAIAALYVVGTSVALYISVWCIGVVVFIAAEALSRSNASTMIVFAATAFLLASLAMSRARLFPGFAVDLLVGIATAGFILALIAWRRAGATVNETPLSKLAHYSYTIYLVHLPFLVLCRCALEILSGFAPGQPVPPALAILLLAVAVSTAYAWAISSITEARTDSVREYLATLFQRAKARVSPA